MWNAHSHQVDPQTVKVTLSGTELLSYGQVIVLWRESQDFRTFFTAQLRASPFAAFFWETPPVAIRTLDRPFEYVLVESTALSRLEPDPAPFRTYFRAQPSVPILTFPNLGGDAILVVPSPLANHTAYTHLAQFLRSASAPQIDAFWQTAGAAMQAKISNARTWLSTAGLGVSWLHLRLDSHPKYYRHGPYRTN